MLYLSQILGRPIAHAVGEKIATIKNVIVRYGSEYYLPVIGLMARLRRRDFFMPQTKIKEIGEKGARMDSTVLDLTPFTRREGKVLLNKDVLDNQLIDVDGKTDLSIFRPASGEG